MLGCLNAHNQGKKVVGFCRKVERFQAKCVHFSKSADGVNDDHGQYGGGDAGIEPIALEGEVEKREHHAQDGGEDERHHAELNAAVGVEGRHTAHDARQGGEMGLCGRRGWVEMTIVGYGFSAVCHQIVEPAQRSQQASQRDTAAQGVADELLDVEFHCGRGISG